MVDAIAPKPGESVCDPACGTGGRELVQGTARVGAMNLIGLPPKFRTSTKGGYRPACSIDSN